MQNPNVGSNAGWVLHESIKESKLMTLSNKEVPTYPDIYHLPLTILTRFRTLSRGCWKEDAMTDTKNVPAVYEGREVLADGLPACAPVRSKLHRIPWACPPEAVDVITETYKILLN